MKKFTMFVFIGTLCCFTLSYISASMAGLTGEKDFANVMFDRYSKAFNPGQEVQINRSFDEYMDVTELEIEAVSTDLILVPVPTGPIQARLEGKYFPENGNPDHVLMTKANSQRLHLKVDEAQPDMAPFQVTMGGPDGQLRVEVPMNIQKVIIKTVSGDIEIKGAAQDWRVETMSGDQSLQILNSSPQVQTKTVSGDIRINFAQKPNVLVKFQSVSGQIQAVDELGNVETKNHRSQLRIGNGTGVIEAKTVSGDLDLTQETSQ